MRHPCRKVIWIAIVFAAFFFVSASTRADDVQQHLRDQYQGKTLLLRGFYTGDKLHYDPAGALVGSATPGNWTTDGVVFLNDIHISGSRLTIKARRLVVSSSHRTLLADTPKNQKKTSPLKIEAELGLRNPSPDQADAAMSKIFLAQQDDFVALVPDYWKPCVRSALIGKDPYCHFSPEFLLIPGTQSSDSNTSTAAATPPPLLLTGPLSRVGHGVSPPHQIFAPEPQFSEPARKAKYQGTVVLGLVVNEDGLPTNVHITAPLGYGLDEKAVQAVQTWKFKPAQKDGQPVRVEIAVEIDFHLY
jgi:TonB family protein